MRLLTAEGQVRLVAWSLSLLGAFTLLCGIMLQGATVVGDRPPERNVTSIEEPQNSHNQGEARTAR